MQFARGCKLIDWRGLRVKSDHDYASHRHVSATFLLFKKQFSIFQVSMYLRAPKLQSIVRSARQAALCGLHGKKQVSCAVCTASSCIPSQPAVLVLSVHREPETLQKKSSMCVHMLACMQLMMPYTAPSEKFGRLGPSMS